MNRDQTGARSQPPDEDVLCVHPPERGSRGRKYVVVYSCCCCCCCCLHTVGGVVGAIAGAGFRADPNNQFDPEHRIPLVHWLFGRLPKVQWLYWTSFLIVIGLSFLVAPAWISLSGHVPFGRSVLETPFYVGVAFILAGPAFQLAAGVVAAIRLAVPRTPPVGSDQWWALGKVMLWTLVGTLIGIAVMFLLFVILAR